MLIQLVILIHQSHSAMFVNKRSILQMLGIFGLVFVVVVALSAWGWQVPNPEQSPALSEQNSVDVTVADGILTLSSTSLSPGEISFVVVNKGSEPHSFAIAGPVEKQGEEQLDGEIASGESKTLEASLEAGTYTAYCPLEGHSRDESVEFTVGR